MPVAVAAVRQECQCVHVCCNCNDVLCVVTIMWFVCGVSHSKWRVATVGVETAGVVFERAGFAHGAAETAVL